jgi:hypothetical protein
MEVVEWTEGTVTCEACLLCDHANLAILIVRYQAPAWVGHVARKWKLRNGCTVLVEIFELNLH